MDKSLDSIESIDDVPRCSENRIKRSRPSNGRRCLCCVYGCVTPLAGFGRSIRRFFQSGSALLSVGNHRGVSEETRKRIRTVFDALTANPRVTCQRLEGILSQIPKNENILVVRNEEDYNLLQKCVGINNLELVRWILSRNPDLNRGACSLPLHIACFKGHEEIVMELIRHGARLDVEARMCWPGPHSLNCEERTKVHQVDEASYDRGSDKLQTAIFYSIDSDEVQTLQMLIGSKEEQSSPFSQKRPLLHVACKRAAWQCACFLVTERSEEINMCYDEFYPVHHAVMHHDKFLQLLFANHACATVVTATEQMSLLHILFLLARKNSDDTMMTCKVLMESGLRELINDPDSLGNTPLHALIVRYALEESRYGYQSDNQPWNKWDMMHLVRFLLQNGARPSINQPGNSALACVLRHVKDLEFRYDLLNMLLQEGGDPNVAGRDGSAPLMVCLVPLINKDPLNQFTHSMKVCYLNCLRILCKHGANPNCSTRSNLTPLHILVFTASENISLSREMEKSQNFEFIRNLLILLLQYGLDPNVGVSLGRRHILQNTVEMVKNTRNPGDLDSVYDLMLTLLQYGSDPNPDPSPNSIAKQPVTWKTNTDFLSYYVFLISRKEVLLDDAQQRFSRIIQLLYLSMDHEPLYTCLHSLCAQLSSLPPYCGSQSLLNVLKSMAATTRTLKQLSRVAIYKALHHRPGLLANKIGLPPPLKDYVLNFEP